MTKIRCDQAPSWLALAECFRVSGRDFDLRGAFAQNPRRFEDFSISSPEVFADLSKNLIDEAAREQLFQLARECELEAQRNAMFDGDAINHTEGRAVLHTALRAPKSVGGSHDAQIHEVLDRLLDFVELIRDNAASGIRCVVHIGIGGSDLGPQMVVPALGAFAHPVLQLRFVSNIDGHDLSTVLRGLNPRETLFVIASKTFTTQETLANAQAAKAWFLAQGGHDVSRHFVATTTNVEAAAAFGITTTFGFWDWVGGRYSIWSAIGLPIALAIGAENFRAFLAGAHAMDQHFLHSPLERNLPVQLGLLDVWYRNFHGFGSRSIAPYHQGLKRLPAYLQQLEMESNGKRVDLDGQALPYATSPVIWGEAGTNGQHAYFQMLHQGSDVIPVEFIAVKNPNYGPGLAPVLEPLLIDQHRKLLANCLAQSQALMEGKTTEQALMERAPTANRTLDAMTLARHRSFPGNRPSTTLVLDELTPRSLGALLAMYEHRVFVSGALWGINSFDQWGVELGKALCGELLPRFVSGDAAGLDSSTAGLLGRLKT